MIDHIIPYGHQHINDDDVQAVISALKSVLYDPRPADWAV